MGHWVAALGYLVGAAVLLKVPTESKWPLLQRRPRDDIAKKSGFPRKRAHGENHDAANGPRDLAANSRGSATKPASKEAKETEEPGVSSPDPMTRGDLTVAELARYDGSDPSLPVLLAAKGVVYDVTKGTDFYGKGGAYNLFTGRDCSRALAKMCLDKAEVTGKVSDLTADQTKVLDDWVLKFESKYVAVGKVIDGDYDGE